MSSTPITEDQIKQFAAAWFLALDQHVPIEQCYDLLAQEGLRMQFPDGDIRDLDGFKTWYDRVTNLFFDENHTVQTVEAKIQGDRADVRVVVGWQASWFEPPAAKSKRTSMDATQDWTVRRSSRNRYGLEIVYYNATASEGGHSMAASRNRDIVERYFSQILNDGNLALVDELFAEDFQFHITTLPLPVKGREGEKGFVTGLRTGFPDIRFRIDHLIEEGDKIYARWSLTGTHDGNFLGIPPTGNRVVDQGGDIFHFVDGRCKEIWVNEDSLGLMRQMGVLPPPPGGEPPPQPTQRPSIPPATRKMTPAENKAIVRRYFDEIMNDANERSIEELISPNFLFTIPTHGPALGPAGEKAEVEMLHTAFPDVHFTIEDEFADAERVAIRWVARGTHLGPFLGIPATGKRFWIDGMGSYHIVDGKMVENQVNEDSLNLLIQVGAIQLPSGNGEGQMTPEENNRIARDFFESAWNRGDFSVLDKYLSPDTVDYSTLHGQPEHGSESFRQIISMFRSAFPDIHLNIEDEIYTGNKVVHRWMLNGTHQAPFMGVPATGKRVGFTGMTIVEMEGGKIRGRWSNPDIMGLMMQLGAIPPPPGG